jgi:hypothetical protein
MIVKFSFFLPVVDCAALPFPANGEIEFSPSTIFQSLAIHTCNEGHFLEEGGSEFNRTCLSNGTWSLEPPNCRGQYSTRIPVEMSMDVMNDDFWMQFLYISSDWRRVPL